MVILSPLSSFFGARRPRIAKFGNSVCCQIVVFSSLRTCWPDSSLPGPCWSFSIRPDDAHTCSVALRARGNTYLPPNSLFILELEQLGEDSLHPYGNGNGTYVTANKNDNLFIQSSQKT